MLRSDQCEAEVLECIEHHGTHTILFWESGMYSVLEAGIRNGFAYIQDCDFVPAEIEAKIEQHQLEDYSWSEV